MIVLLGSLAALLMLVALGLLQASRLRRTSVLLTAEIGRLGQHRDDR